MTNLRYIVVFLTLSCRCEAEELFPSHPSPLLPVVVEMSDLIAAGILTPELGETDKQGNTQMRCHLTDARILTASRTTKGPSDPFATDQNSSKEISMDVSFRGSPAAAPTDLNTLQILTEKRVIVFLKRRRETLENIDAWFWVLPYNAKLEAEITSLVRK